MQTQELVAVAAEGNRLSPELGYHPQPGSRTGYIGVADAFRVVRRRRWLILLVIAAGLLMTGVFLIRTPPVFASATMVMVQTPGQQTSPDGTPTTPAANEDTLIRTKIELLQSRSLARQAVTSLKLADDAEFAARRGKPGWFSRLIRHLHADSQIKLTPKERAQMIAHDRFEGVVDNLLAHLNVDRVAHSNVISVAAFSIDPVKAARISNRMVELFIHNQVVDIREGREADLAALSQQVADARDALQVADMQAAAYRRTHGLTSSRPEESGTLQTNELLGLLADARAKSASDHSSMRIGGLPPGVDGGSSALLSNLRQQEATLSGRVNQLSSFYGDGYPELAQTKADLAAIREQIRQETARVAADRRAQASASSARSAILGASIASMRAHALSDSLAAVPLKALDRKIEATAALYASLLHQLNDKKGALLEIQPDISRVSRGPIPDAPSYPLPKRVLVIAFGASAMLGVMLAFIIEAMDTKLRTAEQVQRLLGLPVLAMVPEVFSPRDPVSSVVSKRPQSRFAEAMRNLLIEVEDRTAGQDGSRVIVVTSPLEGEGKSTIATSLAAAAEAIGREAIVVDLDLRREQVDGAHARKGGVVAYLSNRAGVEELLAPVPKGRFAMIEVGEAASDPAALIASERLPELIEQLRARYAMVVLNAPPILPVRDAKTLARYVDATLLVLRWGRTTPEAAMAAMEVFGQPVIGAVLNQVDYERHAARRYGDTIHYASLSLNYYHPEPGSPAFSAVGRFKRSIRRMGGSVAEALHLG